MSGPSDWGVTGSTPEIYESVFVPAMVAEWIPRVIALANPGVGEHVLDAACGTGVLTRSVASLVGPNGRVVGLDLNPAMLAVARMSAPDPSNAVPIEWREGDVGAVPYESDAFDIVFCTWSLMFFPDRVACLKEMRRVLKPDGCLALSVWGSISKCPGQMAMKESWERHLGADVGDRISRQHVLGEPEIVRSLIAEAGFRDISVETAMGAVRIPSPEQLARSYGAMAGILADEKTRDMVIDDVSRALESYVGVEGLAYPIEAVLAWARK